MMIILKKRGNKKKKGVREREKKLTGKALTQSQQSHVQNERIAAGSGGAEGAAAVCNRCLTVGNDVGDGAAGDEAEADSMGHGSNEAGEYLIASWTSVNRLLHCWENCHQT